MLHNYGGTRGIYGNLTTIATSPIDAMNTPGSTMIGVGMTPEAIEHNPVVYDLMVSLNVIFSCSPCIEIQMSTEIEMPMHKD